MAVVTWLLGWVVLILKVILLAVLLIMGLAYFVLPFYAGNKVKDMLEDKIERSGRGAVIIWFGALAGGIACVLVVQGIISLISTVTSSGDPFYLNTLFINFISSVASSIQPPAS